MSPGALASAVLALAAGNVDGAATVDEGGAPAVLAAAVLVADAADVLAVVAAVIGGVVTGVDDDGEEQAAATTTAATAQAARHVSFMAATVRAADLRAIRTEQSDSKLIDQIARR